MTLADADLHVLVTGAIGYATVFCDILENGLTCPSPVVTNDSTDSITCGLVMDFDLDGTANIVLGTYGHEVLVFREDTRRQHRSSTVDSGESPVGSRRASMDVTTPTASASPATTPRDRVRSSSDRGAATSTSAAPFRYKRAWAKRFTEPVYSLRAVDLNLDGLDELTVCTMFSWHCLQSSLESAKKRAVQGLTVFKRIRELEAKIEVLQARKQGMVGKK